MAVPKMKVSKARKNSRNAHNFRAKAAVLTPCPQCHEAVNPHTVCKNCGFYKGQKRIDGVKDKKEAKAKAAAAAQG